MSRSPQAGSSSGHAVERSVEGWRRAIPACSPRLPSGAPTGRIAGCSPAPRWIALPELVGAQRARLDRKHRRRRDRRLALVLTRDALEPGAGTVMALIGAAPRRSPPARRWRCCAARTSAPAGSNGRSSRCSLWLCCSPAGLDISAARASTTPPVLALVAAAAQLLVERAPSRPRRWRASPSANLLILTPFALAGFVRSALLHLRYMPSPRSPRRLRHARKSLVSS